MHSICLSKADMATTDGKKTVSAVLALNARLVRWMVLGWPCVVVVIAGVRGLLT